MCFSRRAAIRQPRWDTASTHNISVAVGFSFWSHLHLQMRHIGSSRRREVAKNNTAACVDSCVWWTGRQRKGAIWGRKPPQTRTSSFIQVTCVCVCVRVRVCVCMQHGCFSYPLNKTWISLRSGLKALGRKLFSVTFSLSTSHDLAFTHNSSLLCHVSV